ncbi:ABC transporter permease [Sphingosinicella terrae]|jgi:ABC-2 type transport system permease protein|uniref:ABC transporter permease n=1 Tax=Sphingosinicella terrae TaxID=2172047 RepID=UPI000E0CF2B8|nr:ABC transporter permease [Sphingosinicella terrae]
MMSMLEAAWVIARRDFVATVYSRSFIFFLLAPLILLAFVFFGTSMAEEAGRSAAHPKVAVVADSATVGQLMAARQHLVAGTNDRTFPRLELVAPAENLAAQAQALLADEAQGFSAVFTGTIDRPVLTGPARVDDYIGVRIQLIVDTARRNEAIAAAGTAVPPVTVERVVSQQAAGNLQLLRQQLAAAGQGLIFGVTIMLATLLLSNLVEEKSNKVIEVLAAAVPLDAVFFGKLIAMLGISAVGITLWAGMLGLGYVFFQMIQDWMALPQVSPAVGWPAFGLLLLLYYCTNFMLLGGLFLGIGGQASNIREIQTISMPVTLLQVLVFLLAMNAIGMEGGALATFAYIFPFSSPLVMVAHAAKYEALWPHLLALAWQAAWVFVIIRASARLFRLTVMKSSAGGAFFSFGRLFGRRAGSDAG